MHALGATGMVREYFVVRRGAEWWVAGWPGTVGPYVSRNVAHRAAISQAKKDFRNHVHSKVFVEEGLRDGMTMIYDSSVDR